MPDESSSLRSDPWRDRLSEYVDGDLDASTREALESHLATCAECRTTVGALERVIARARTLAYRAPAGDLWHEIARDVSRTRSHVPRHRLITMSLGRLVAAAALVATVAAGIAWELASRRTRIDVARVDTRAADAVSPVSDAPAATSAVALASYREAAADLERLLESSRSSLRPETMAVIEANLRTIDAAIAQADSALRRDPGSAYLNQYLAATMQRKLKLLRRAVEITTARS